MHEVLISGLVLGLAAGFSPGPLMALVLSQTLRHGTREGCKAALVPLVTDLPVIALSLLLTTQLAHLDLFLGVISLAGGCFVLYLAWESFRPVAIDSGGPEVEARTWRKGILTNLLSPNPWLFWFTVGAASLTKATAESWVAALLFLSIFYLLLCGTKAVLALIAGRSRAFLSGKAYRLILSGLGMVLVVFALTLFRDALSFLAIAPR